MLNWLSRTFIIYIRILLVIFKHILTLIFIFFIVYVLFCAADLLYDLPWEIPPPALFLSIGASIITYVIRVFVVKELKSLDNKKSQST